MKRVSEKLSMAQRIAAHEDGASSPTPVTMPAAMIAIGFMTKDLETRLGPVLDSQLRLLHFLRFFCTLAGFFTFGAACVHQCLQRRIVSLAQLACPIPAARH